MAGTPPMQPTSAASTKPRTKAEVCAAFLERLQARRNLELTPELLEGIEQHFRLLPSRYALDVNIGSLDVLNHKRLLDSARNDPSAVSFQVRPVDIVSTGSKAAPDRRPSFGNVDSLLEVRTHTFFSINGFYNVLALTLPSATLANLWAALCRLQAILEAA